MKSGNPIPWLTYASLAFLETLDLSQSRITEFGGGASTLYFENQASQVVTFEPPGEWADKLENSISKPSTRIVRLDIGLCPLPPTTVQEIDLAVAESDVVLIDGGNRNTLISRVATSKSVSLIIVDNADRREEILGGLKELATAGWVEIPFESLGPLNCYGWRTSIFVRSPQDLLRFRNQSNSGANTKTSTRPSSN